MENFGGKEFLIKSHIKRVEKWKKITSLLTIATRIIYLLSAIAFCWVFLLIDGQVESIKNKYIGYLYLIGMITAIFTFTSKAISKYSFIVSISLTNDINRLENEPLSELAIDRTRDAFNYIYAMIALIISMFFFSIPILILIFNKSLLNENISTTSCVISLSLIVFSIIKYFQYAYSTRQINRDIGNAIEEYHKKNKK